MFPVIVPFPAQRRKACTQTTMCQWIVSYNSRASVLWVSVCARARMYMCVCQCVCVCVWGGGVSLCVCVCVGSVYQCVCVCGGGGGGYVCVCTRARAFVCVCCVSVVVHTHHTTHTYSGTPTDTPAPLPPATERHHTHTNTRARAHTHSHTQRINTPLSMSFALGIVGNVTESCFVKLCLRAFDCCRRLACNLRSIEMIVFGCFHRFKPVRGVTREFVSLIRTRIAHLRAGFLPFYSLSSLSHTHTHAAQGGFPAILNPILSLSHTHTQLRAGFLPF